MKDRVAPNLVFTLVMAFLHVAVAPAAGRTIFVDADATGLAAGTSWPNAYRCLQDALAAAWGGSEIRVAQGVYKPDQGRGVRPGDRMATFELKRSVVIKGGYAGFGEPNPNERNIQSYETILSGDLAGNDKPLEDPAELRNEPSRYDNSYNVVAAGWLDPSIPPPPWINPCSVVNKTTVLDGFTITGGYAHEAHGRQYYGGGMYNHYASPTVSNCKFIWNYAEMGAGIFISSCSPTIANCTFRWNCTYGGGAIVNREASPAITDCIFEKNHRGAIDNDRGSPSMANCTFIGNTTVRGAAIQSYAGSPTFRDCRFEANHATQYGGAIHVLDECTLTLTNCTFINNSGNHGSAIESYHSHVTMSGCTFVKNSGDVIRNYVTRATTTNCDFRENSGIAVHNRNANATITDCTFHSNTGAMFNRNSSSIVADCTFAENQARDGGAITNTEGSNANLLSCRFVRNHANNEGGALYLNTSKATLTNCTFIANTVSYRGGVIYLYDESDVSMANCTLAGNSSRGGAVACNSRSTGKANGLRAINCIFWNGKRQIDIYDASKIEIHYSDIEGGWLGTGNIAKDPCFALQNDYHLLPDSPCIDSGADFSAGLLPETDVDGNPRIADGDADGTAVVDMGAHEYNPNDPSIVLLSRHFFYVHGWPEPTAQSQTLRIRNCGGRPLYWRIIEECDWLTVTPARGVCTDQVQYITLTLEPKPLPAGHHSCVLTVVDANAVNGPQEVHIYLYVPQTFCVPTEYETIQAAIDAAADYDVVLVADGIYTGEGNRDIDFNGKAVTLLSETGPDNCIIDCQATLKEHHRAFFFHNNEDANSILDGFTITNGYHQDGGAIRCFNASPAILNCVIKSNTAEQGGGILCEKSDLEISNCIVFNNTVTQYGGGIYIDSSRPTLVNCVICSNIAGGMGGAIYNGFYGSPILINCTIAGNCATDCGGAIVNTGWSSPTFTNCILWENSAQQAPEIFVGRYTKTSDVVITYSDIQGGWSGEGNIDTDPSFAFANDYHLVPDSPCIDAGWDTTAEDLCITDLDGNPRRLDGNADGIVAIDMGAYEHNPDRSLIAISASTVNFLYIPEQREPPDQTVLVRNCGGGALNWKVSEDCDWLRVFPDSGSSTGKVDEVMLSVDVSDLGFGDYSCDLAISAPDVLNSPKTVLVTLQVLGEVVYVPDDLPAIQEAIDYVLEGGTVLVADGIYTGPGNRDIDFKGKAITVRSENGLENCIIDCNGTEEDRHSAFFFHYDEDGNSILDGFTIVNGRASSGGAIHCYQSSPTITNCIISRNSATYKGGAIYCSGGSPTFQNCTIVGNLAQSDPGGAIYSTGSSPAISNCTISGNRADGGGGIYCSGGSPTITNCTISGNEANSWPGCGGGLSCNYGSPTITHCKISANAAENSGGGISYRGSTSLAISHCVISGNRARDGGAIHCEDCPPPPPMPCYVQETNDGAVRKIEVTATLYSDRQCNAKVANCTITGNFATHAGGAIFCHNADATITNCTVAGNWAPEGCTLACDSYKQWQPSNPKLANCILWSNGREIWNNDDSAITISYGNIKGHWPGTGNIDADPHFVDPGYWTHANDPNIAIEPNHPNAIWIDGDYHLRSQGWRWDRQRKVWTWDDVTSLSIDAGNPGSPLGEEPLTVPGDPNNEWGQNLRINMGAYGGRAEASVPPHNWAILGDLTNDGMIDSTDFAYLSQGRLSDANDWPGDLDRNGIVDMVDFGLLAQDWLKQTVWHQ